MKKECIVLVYNSFRDPLFQNLMYRYMLDITTHTSWTFHLITYEQTAYQIKDKKPLIAQLRKQRIHWYPKYHRTGNFLIFKKALDVLSAVSLITNLRRKGVRIIWSFANIASSITYIYSKLFRVKTIIYSYEPHSLFMAELGMWKTKSIKFKLLNFLEWRAGIEADYVLTGTKFMVEELKRRGAKGILYRAPTSVDENIFIVNEEFRRLYRQKINADDKKVLIYVGKFGGLYYDQEIYELIKQIDSNISNMFFLIATPEKHEEIERKLYAAGLKSNFKVTYLDNSKDVVGYLNAADIGLNAIPPTPSQRYRSPTKIAEYLLCGLPYITCKGISEDDIYADTYGVGIVLNSFKKGDIIVKLTDLEKLMENRVNLVSQCRKVGLSYRAKSNVVNQLINIFQSL